VSEQINDLKQQMKDMELEITNYRRRCEEAESNFKKQKQQFETARGERNICSKNLLEARVSNVGITLMFLSSSILTTYQ